MYVRCAKCGIATRILPREIRGHVTCPSCGEKSAIALESIGRTDEERFQKAQAYATMTGTDLASAYSVLLGLLPAEKAVRLDGDSPAGATSTAPPEKDSPARRHFDRGFADAVAHGFLSPAEAAQRGDRVVFASRLARRHNLPMYLAFLVADNRVRLAHAVELAKSPNPPQTGPESCLTKPSHPLRKVAVSAAVVIAIGCACALAWRTDKPPAAPSLSVRTPRASIDVAVETRRDPEGRLTAVRASTPQAVLDGFCRVATEAGERRPVGITPNGGSWTGHYREGRRTGSIRIERDGENAFRAGNAVDPIEQPAGTRNP